MKKALLSVAALAASVFTGLADEYTFVLDGTNDLGGLTRQTSTKEADLTFSDSFTLSEEGIDLSVTKADGKGLGFALVNAGGTNAGLCVFVNRSTPMTPEFRLTAPGGKINSVRMYMSGVGLVALDIPFNGKVTESVNDNSLYYWEWTDSEGAESVTWSWLNSYNVRYVHSIEVSYTPDLGGKQASGLSFAAKEYEAIIGEAFSSPSLKNPNKLDVSWSSSDEAVATVDSKGKVTLEGRGTATITAATAGNDEFAAGNAKYTLTVIPMASNIAQLLEYAPAVYDRVKVNFPATVNYAINSIAFVTDAEGNAACFDDIRNRNSTGAATTLYKVGQVIPAGWMATNATIYESVIWEGIPEKVTETVEVTYPKVEGVTPADADRVVILKNVTFEKATPVEETKGYGTTPDGTRYEFQNIYGAGSMPAGTYDVTGVVRYSKLGTTEYFYLAPISYSEPSGDSGSATEAKYPTQLDFTLNGEKELAGVTVSSKMVPYDGSEYLKIEITGESDADEITMDFATPEGWDYALIALTDGEGTPMTAKAAKGDHWYPVSTVTAMGYQKGNSFVFPIDGREFYGTIYLVKEDKVWEYSIDVECKVSKAGGGDVEVPAYPTELEYTLNGEKELPGITVRQLLDETTHVFSVNGKCDSDYITITFETPEGWDGLMIADTWGEGEISTVKTRGAELIPVEDILSQGFKEGNTITYKTDGEAQWGEIALIKGDMACTTFINYDVTVSKSGGSVEPGDDYPAFPESLIVNTFNEGLEVSQYEDWGTLTVKVEGEVADSSFPVVIDVPEGWDGFVCYNWSENDVIISDNDQAPRRTRSEELEMMPLEELLGEGYVKGNRFTFEPTYDPEYNNFQTVEIHLYKGDMATAEYFNLEVYVSKAETETPEVPESFEVNVTPDGLTVTQGEDYGVYTINVTGECEEDEVQVTIAVPEGWDGFVGMTDSDFEDNEAQPLKKAQAIEWEPIDYMLEWGFRKTNTLTFKVDGEMHSGALYLYKGDLVDGANPISVYTEVTNAGSGVGSVDSAAKARYYDLNGTEVSKPAAGVYVKKENGKTTKVIVK